MNCQTMKIGCVWKIPLRKSGHIYLYYLFFSAYKIWKANGAALPKIKYKVFVCADTLPFLFSVMLPFSLSFFQFFVTCGWTLGVLIIFLITWILHKSYWYFIAVALTICFIHLSILLHDVTFHVNYNNSIEKFQF